MYTELDLAIRKLSREHPESRPFICDGSPIGCTVAIVGINPATDTPFWPFWSHISGFDRAAWLAEYRRRHLGKRTPTRDRIEELIQRLLPLRVMELNLYHMPSRSERELPNSSRSTELFDFMLDAAKPSMLVVHGASPRRHLEQRLGCRLVVDAFTRCSFGGFEFEVFVAKKHFCYLPGGIAEIRAIAMRIQDRLAHRQSGVVDSTVAQQTRPFDPAPTVRHVDTMESPARGAVRADPSSPGGRNIHAASLDGDDAQLAWNAVKQANVVLRRWTRDGASGRAFAFRVRDAGRGEALAFLRDGEEVKSASYDRFAAFYSAWRAGQRDPTRYLNGGAKGSKAQVIHYLIPLFNWLESSRRTD